MDTAILDANSLGREQVEEQQRRLFSTIQPFVVALLIAISLAATFLAGQQRGMVYVSVDGPSSEQRSIAVALSDVVFKLNLGYLGYVSVLNALDNVWDSGEKAQKEFHSTRKKAKDYLNSAIHAAASTWSAAARLLERLDIVHDVLR